MSAAPASAPGLSGTAPFSGPSSRSEQSAVEESAVLPSAQHLASATQVDAPQGSCEASACAIRSEAADPILPEAQRRWAARAIPERLQVLRKARHWIAAHPQDFSKAISIALARSEADTLVTELLPLLEAIRFLERNARKLLAPRKLGTAGRPLWLTGVHAEVYRDPLGHVLVIAPANFPLFLPGVQALQALVAGNAVTWKPGTGGEQVALLLAHALREAGLPRGILRVTGESVQAAEQSLAEHPDKVVFTGSFNTGRSVLAKLAETATPATMELSGADAVIVLPSADLPVTARAVAFGLRLNGAEICMSPRRLLGTRETLSALRPLLQAEFAKVPAVTLKPATANALTQLLSEASAQGATLSHALTTTSTQPILVDRASPTMAITRSDIFAPVLSLIEVPSTLHLPDIANDCSYALTAAIFGNPTEAETLAQQLRVGTVLINDLIAPTADPRVPFGGRGSSGFGTTRGAEGLLEMTAAKTVLRRKKPFGRTYDPLSNNDVPLFASLIGTLHGSSLSTRWQSLRSLITAARNKPKH